MKTCRRWPNGASTPSGAGSWTFIRGNRRCPSAWNGSTTRSSRSASSISTEQTSVRSLERCPLLLKVPEAETVALRDYLRKKDLIVSVDVEEIDCHIRLTGAGSGLDADRGGKFRGRVFPLALCIVRRRSLETPALRDAFARQVREQLHRWDAEGYRVVINLKKRFRSSSGARRLFADFTQNFGTSCFCVRASVNSALSIPAGGLAVIFAAEILGSRHACRTQRRPPCPAGRAAACRSAARRSISRN